MQKMKRSLLIALAAGCVSTPAVLADTLLVPSQYPTIQDAIDAAMNFDEILVSPGTYFEAIDFQGKTISLKSTGGAAVTTINGSGLPTSTVTISGSTFGTEFVGFTVVAGQGTDVLIDANDPGLGTVTYAGGMYILAANVEIRDSVFRDGFVTGLGGAMRIATGSDVQIINCSFTNNTADDTGSGGINTGRGGAISLGGNSVAAISTSTFTNNTANNFGGAISFATASGSIADSSFSNNSTPAGGGGGAMFVLGAEIAITNSTFESNTSERGGAMHFNTDGFGTISGSTFQNNSSSGAESRGGAIYALGTANANPIAEIVFDDCDFIGNSVFGTTGDGGAMYLTTGTTVGPSEVVVSNSRITGNSADRHGGGIYILNARGDVVDSTISNNTATTDGGGVYYSSGGRGLISGSTLSGNSAVRGGGVVSFRGIATIENSTFDANLASFRGGGVCLLASTVGPGQAFLDNVTISNHTVPDDGAGVYALRGIGVIENSTISNNSAFRGGGIGAFASTSGGSEFTIINTAVNNNTASSTGGGMYGLRATVSIEGSSFRSNSATLGAGRGGGLSFAATASGGSVVDLFDVTLEGNSAEEFGGGMGISGSTTIVNGDRIRIVGNESVFLDAGGLTITGGTVNLSNILIADNTGANFGGSGISMSGSADVTLTNATIYGNRNPAANAAIAEGGTLTLNNSIVWDNDGVSGIDPLVTATVSHSIVEGGFGGTNVLDVDPQLADPNNGDYTLVAASPAVDAGLDNLSSGLTLDLAGNARFVGTVDMGAFEFQSGGPVDCLGDIADDFGFTVNEGGGPDGQVEFGDFVALLGLIGPCPGGPGCLGDIADDFGFTVNEGGGPDGQVEFGDFVALLGLIGPCP